MDKLYDPAKLFVYTLGKNGDLTVGPDIKTGHARAVLAFPQPQNLTAEQLWDVTEQASAAPRAAEAVEQIVKKELLGGREEVLCLDCFLR